MTDVSVRVLAATNMYPTTDDPTYGIFVASQMRSVADLGLSVRVQFIDGREGSWRYAEAILLIRRLAASGAFDLVHAHYGLTGFVGCFHRLPLVVSFCGDDLLGTPNGRGGLTAKSRVIRWLSRKAALRADSLICKSDELRMRLPREIDRARAHVIPNGVDTERFCPGDRGDARERLSLDSTERLILFPSTPTERRKRLDLAEAAVASLCAKGISARLVVVQRASHDRMPDYYRAADCLLLTSDWEGSPNVVKEALCCDLPVVSVDAGDVRGWFSLTAGCRLVEREPEAIAQGLAEVLRAVPHVNGKRIREEVGLAKVASQVLDVYKRTLARRGRLSQKP